VVAPVPRRRTRSDNSAGTVRVAHLTDFHIQPELQAARGVAQCLHHAQSLPRKPDLILNTGDCVFETLHTDRARTQTQWDLWQSVLKERLFPPDRTLPR
jgi:hypothetical protein